MEKHNDLTPKESVIKSALNAIRKGDIKELESMFSKLSEYKSETEAEDLLKIIVNKADKDGVTPLHIAAFEGNENIVKKLIDARANINKLTTMESLLFI